MSRPTLGLKKPPPTAPRPADVPVEAFFFVWAPDANRPRVRHPTREAAEAEAARLRAVNPAREFLVYAATLIDEKEPRE